MYAKYKGFPKGNTQMNVSKFIILKNFTHKNAFDVHPNLVINKNAVI
jgi:hypothetical protein